MKMNNARNWYKLLLTDILFNCARLSILHKYTPNQAKTLRILKHFITRIILSLTLRFRNDTRKLNVGSIWTPLDQLSIKKGIVITVQYTISTYKFTSQCITILLKKIIHFVLSFITRFALPANTHAANREQKLS